MTRKIATTQVAAAPARSDRSPSNRGRVGSGFQEGSAAELAGEDENRQNDGRGDAEGANH
jgi:hypothetical protein